MCVCECSFQSGSVLFELQHRTVNIQIWVEAVDGESHCGWNQILGEVRPSWSARWLQTWTIMQFLLSTLCSEKNTTL